MKKKINREQGIYLDGLIKGALIVALFVLAGKLFYKINLDIIYEAKILSGILGGIFVFFAIYLLIKSYNKLK